MTNPPDQTQKARLPRWLWVWVILAIMGIGLRFYHLGYKVYWYDEVYTSMHVASTTRPEIQDRWGDRPFPIGELQQAQRPAEGDSLRKTIDGLRRDDVHPPLYFSMVWGWARLVDGSPAGVRSLSAVLAVLALPLMGGVAWALWRSPLTTAIAIGLMAVSPYHVLYAQEARSYSLLTVLMLGSSWLLLRAARGDRSADWVGYSITVALGLYVHLFAFFVTIGHGLYLAIAHRWQWGTVCKPMQRYRWAVAAGVAAFLPWLVISPGFLRSAGFTARRIPLEVLVQRWLINLAMPFFDAQVSDRRQLFDVLGDGDLRLGLTSPALWICGAIALLSAYALWHLWQQRDTPTDRAAWWFVLTLMAVTGLLLLLPDLILGGQRSTIGRFLIPCLLGVQLAIARLFAQKLESGGGGGRSLWCTALITLAALGIVSCSVSAQASTWWIKYSSYYQHDVAALIQQAETPLVVSNNPIRLMALSHTLPSETTAYLYQDRLPLERLPFDTHQIFVVNPDRDLVQAIDQQPGYRLQPVLEQGFLWQLVRA